LVEAPRETPPDLAERFRQMKVFDDAEVALVRACVKRPDRLARASEIALRQALNLARLWVISSGNGGGELVVGPLIGSLRDRLRVLAQSLLAGGDDLDPASFGRDAEQLLPMIREGKETILSRCAGRLMPSVLDREISQKSLVLVLGGGGGCGYVHLGALSVLESVGAIPSLIVGSSLGSILGLFRAREVHFRDSMVRAVTHGLNFKKLFRVLEVDSRYGLPGTLRLYLRSALSRFFVGDRGDTLRVGELTIPFVCVVTGIRREAIRREIVDYEKAFARELRRGAFGALLHIKDLIRSWAALMADLIATPGGLKAIPLGAESDTLEFDALDAVGFSCAVPALIHYDILREDPRMDGIMRAVMQRHDVDCFIDGGVASNVPARAAWETVQRGRIGTRNVFILGLDCFAPQLRRNMLFLPVQRIAAENVARDRPFAHHFFAYKKVLSPASLVPSHSGMASAIENGRLEFSRETPFVQKMIEPLPPI
jgi:predicted acylesterase/phospholipase RssA